MNRYEHRFDDLDLGGVPDLESLRATDELLDRLGRREPDPRDLDDPVAAALAVLAGDVDLGSVPVWDTQRAAASVGLWPLPSVWEPASAPAGGHGYLDDTVGWATTPLPAEHLPRPARSVPAARSAEPLRRPRNTTRQRQRQRPRPQLDHPRVLRLRPAAGVAAAAVLVLLGGGVSVAVSDDSLNPLTGITTVVGRWTDDRTDQQRRDQQQLSAKVQEARHKAESGDAAGAAKLIAEVEGQLPKLTGDDRKKLTGEMLAVRGSLPSSASGPGAAGAPFDAAGATGSTGASDSGATGSWGPTSVTGGGAASGTVRSGPVRAGSRPAGGRSVGPGGVVAAGQPITAPDHRPAKGLPFQHDERPRPTATGTPPAPTTTTTDPSTTVTTVTTVTSATTSDTSSSVVSSSASSAPVAAASSATVTAATTATTAPTP